MKQKITMSDKLFIVIVWIMIGLTMSLSFMAMRVSGHYSFALFYDVGRVYEIHNQTFQVENACDGGHSKKDGTVVFDQGYYEYGIELEAKNTNQWNYFCLNLKDVTSDELSCRIVFERWKDGELQDQESMESELQEGMNTLEIPDNYFTKFYLRINGEKGTTVKVTAMQLRTNKPHFTLPRAIKIVSVCMLAYMVATSVFIWLWKRYVPKVKYYLAIDRLQDVYLFAGNQLKKVSCRLGTSESKCRRFVRTLAIDTIILYTVFVDIQNTYYKNFHQHIVIYAALTLVLACCCIEEKLVKVNWNHKMVWSWFGFCVLACVSDALVFKKSWPVGIVLLLGIGFYNFVWNNMEHPEHLIGDFVRAIHVFLILALLFCLICRPEVDNTERFVGIRYAGISRNPAVTALCMTTVWAVILGTLDSKLKAGKPLKSMFPYILEGCAVFSVCWKTQSAAPLLTMVGIAFLWFISCMIHANRKAYKKKIIMVVLSALILLVPVYSGFTWGINHIPKALRTTVVFEGEEPQAKLYYGSVAYAADGEETSRLAKKLQKATLSGLFSGRDHYYRLYLRNMNLLGHKDRPKMWGHRRQPHNAVLGIAYQYGVFAAVPYILLMILTIVRTFKYSRKSVRYASVPFYVCFSAIISSIVDNVEQPYVWLPWIGLYFMMGCGFMRERNSVEEVER